MTNIHLGYTVGSGEPVEIPLRHMVVTGQTQEAGKTTTLEALVARSKLPAVAFVTKRGEGAFCNSHWIPPYFRERADWQFVASVLEATMRERLKFERAWIMRASKGARTLADVQKNVRNLMEKAKGISADVYLTLDSYLDIVVPRVASITFAEKLHLLPGVNVLQLSDREQFPSELQALVMRSALEWIYESEQGTIAIIPEAWEFLPQGRGSPVKLAAIELIRKGAGLKNYVWLDSQDIGGIDKELLRSCPVWLLGVQRESNEIKRTLDNIPASIAKPKPADISTLARGQFFACWGNHVVKTYVQPKWIGESEAIEIARGSRQTRPDPGRRPPPPPAPPKPNPKEPAMSAAVEAKIAATDAKVDKLLDIMTKQAAAPPRPPVVFNDTVQIDEESLYQRFKTQLLSELPVGGGTIVVTPPEKLRKDFQREESERIVAAIQAFDKLGKRILKLMEGLGGYLPQKHIAERLGKPTAGGSWVTLGTQVKELAEAGFLIIDGKRGVTAATRAKIAADLSSYQPTDDEVEAVYQQVLFVIATDE